MGILKLNKDSYHGSSIYKIDDKNIVAYSASDLIAVMCQSAYHMFYAKFLAAKRDSAAMAFGRVAHSVILNEEGWSDRIVVLPYPDFRTKAAKESRDAAVSTGMEVILEKDMDSLKLMRDGLIRSRPDLVKLMASGHKESGYIQPAGEIHLKALHDFLTADGEVSIDYKTSKSDYNSGINSWSKNLNNWAGMIRLAHYTLVGELDKCTVYYLVQEKIEPYDCTVFLADQHLLAESLSLHSRAVAATELAHKKLFADKDPADVIQNLDVDSLYQTLGGGYAEEREVKIYGH